MMIANKRTEIVPASSTDLIAIRDIATRIWNEYYPAIISQAQIEYMLAMDYSPEKLQQDMSSGIRIDKLLLDGILVGFSAYGPVQAADTPAQILKLHKIYVDPAVHGTGLGSCLLERVETFARAGNYTKVILQVNKGNQRAINAYTRNGYIVERALVVDIGEGFVMDDYLMVKQLIPSDQ
jgi:GNAT superfamily N-acetyltransferase